MDSANESLTITPHPVLKLPSREAAKKLGETALRALLLEREELIAREKNDPYNFGFYLESWKDADSLIAEYDPELFVIFGGNGSGKTYYCAKKGVDKMLSAPEMKVLWLHESEKTSILVQQSAVWNYLPAELKVQDIKKHWVKNIRYSIKDGFSDNKFVMMNGSIGVFGSYKQAIKDYEGTGWDLIIADENLPLAWLKTLMVRLPRRDGRFIWSYTPIDGMTPAINHVRSGAITLESRHAPLLPRTKRHVEDCPRGQMPYIQKGIWGNTMLMYFRVESNPYQNNEYLRNIIVARGEQEVMRRWYGYAENMAGVAFPRFCRHHIVAPEKIPKKLCRRHYADPASARNMFMLWIGTDEHERHYVYREWPDLPHFGEWAVNSEEGSKWDGEAGPAQKSVGYGVLEYKRIILEAEGAKWDGNHWELNPDEEIWGRYMDPRSGATQVIVEREGGNCLIDMMAETQLDNKGDPLGTSLVFEAAPGVHEDQGRININDLLSYDASAPITPFFNEPRLYVSSDCQNLIWALQNYTGHDGDKAACKDPIDCLRYFATGDTYYSDTTAMAPFGGGTY